MKDKKLVFVKMRSGLPELWIFFVEIMPDKVILDHKESYLIYSLIIIENGYSLDETSTITKNLKK